MPTYTAAAVGGNWNSAATWGGAGVPTTNDIVLFNQTSGNVTVTSGARCSEINFNSGTGYTGTITFTNTLTIDANTAFATSGNITLTNALGFTLAGPNGISWNSSGNLSRIFTSNGKAFNLPFNTAGNGGNTITLTGDFTVSNLAVNINVINGSNLIINGNVVAGSIIGSGTSSCILSGASTTWNNASILSRVVFNSSGTITISGTVTCTASITWTNGTLVTTGSTLTMSAISSISLAGRTLNNMSFSTTATVCVVTGDFTLVGNLSFTGSGPAMNGAGRVFVLGNVSGSGNSGSFRIEMNGTSSTISGTINQSVIINTAGTITVGTSCDIGAFSNLTLTAGTLNLANNLTRRGGTTTIAIGFLFTGLGNLIFRDVQFQATTHTVTSNGVSFPNSVQINPSTNIANSLTLNDNFTVLGDYSSLLGSSSGQVHTIDGSNLLVRGNFTVTTTGGIIGTSTIVLEGSSSTNLTTSGQIQNNLTVNKSGGATLSILSSFTWGAAGRSLLKTAGNINPGSSTISIPASISVTISNMTLNSLTIGANCTINQGILNTINSTLLLSGNATFTGTAGWATNNFTHGGAGFTCTLQAGVTYTVTGLFTMVGTASGRAVLQSNNVQNVQVSISALSDQMILNSGTIPNPSTGYVLGSRAFTDVLPAVLNALLPDRPTILSGTANPYTLTEPIEGTAVASSLLLQLGKKAFFNVTAGTGSTFVAYAATRDIDSSGGIEIQAAQSYSDAIGQPSPNLFRTINWRPLIAPSSSTYYTWIK